MLFSSPVFFLFFAIYFLCHLVTPPRYRNILIIAGSTIFYAWWKWEFVWLPYLLLCIAYGGVQWLSKATDTRVRKWRTVCVVTLLFVPLIVFKYTNFIYLDVVGIVVPTHEKLLDLALPLGVSFMTFTLTAYIIDVYRGRFRGEHKFSAVLAYVLFFPHLIAGPILRPVELIPQLEHPRKRRMLWPLAAITIFSVGLVKKLVFADQIAGMVDAIYLQDTLSAPEALLALYGFAVQIYCDFSGYTDMAIGLALLLGIRLPLNFRRPYAAASLTEFWRRWHITLSSWLRDYLYIPLGGSRVGRMKELRNIMVTMILGGLWHGANWTFIVWGMLHGIGIALLHTLKRLSFMPPVPRWVGMVLTFHWVAVAWVFFRAPDVPKALQILHAPFAGEWEHGADLLTGAAFPICLMIIFAMLHGLDDRRHIHRAVKRVRKEFLLPALLFLWMLAITVSQGSSAKFVYFDF